MTSLICLTCGRPVRMICQTGTGYCCQECATKKTVLFSGSTEFVESTLSDDEKERENTHLRSSEYW